MWTLIARFLARPRIANLVFQFAKRRIYDKGHIFDPNGSLYMGRWWVFKEHAWSPYAARLHLIAREDQDRDLHDHPYAYRTIILQGGYWWIDLFGGRWHIEVGQTEKQAAEHFHKIVEVTEGGVWTLFIYRHKKKSNPWGFLKAEGGTVVKVPWQQYLGDE
jgi:hypothetical protein